MRKVAVIRKAIDAKIDRTIFRLVRVVAFEKFPNHLDHLRDIDRFGSSWIGGSRFDAQSRYIVLKRPAPTRRKVWERFASRAAGPGGSVLHVRQIHPPIDSKATRLHMALQHVFQ